MEKELIVVKGKVIEQKKGFSPTVGDDIGYELGAKWIKNYYDQNQDDVLAHFMGRNMIEAILAQPGVVGIRMFHAYNDLGIKQLILVGVNEHGQNILSYTTVGDDGKLIKKKGIVADKTRMCPPYCGSGDGSAGDILDGSWV